MVSESREVIKEIINKLNNSPQIYITDNGNLKIGINEVLQEIIKRHYEDRLYNLDRKEK